MMKQEDLLMRLKEHKPLIINFGKGYCYSRDDITEKIKWDNEENEYVGETFGVWKLSMLLEIAKGNVKDTRLEIGG